MPSLKTILPLALAGGAVANPLLKRGDACLAAVTGAAALGDAGLRKSHCSSYLSTIVTPSAITVTTTITGAPAPTSSGWNNWARDVTVCPNEVPNYASACDDAQYQSACSVWGITSSTTITIPATTTTATVWAPTGCAAGNTVTVTVAASTVTVTSPSGSYPTGGSSPSGPNCLTDDKAQYFANSFSTLLQYTSYNGTQGAKGRGYQQNVSDAILSPSFSEYSDSINFMAGTPLGSVTFANKTAFDIGQGHDQPELTMTTLNVWHGCNQITWRWHAQTQSQASVIGISSFEMNGDNSKIQTSYVEFDNGEWLESFGQKCALSG